MAITFGYITAEMDLVPIEWDKDTMIPSVQIPLILPLEDYTRVINAIREAHRLQGIILSEVYLAS
jgi:hypothetical protein